MGHIHLSAQTFCNAQEILFPQELLYYLTATKRKGTTDIQMPENSLVSRTSTCDRSQNVATSTTNHLLFAYHSTFLIKKEKIRLQNITVVESHPGVLRDAHLSWPRRARQEDDGREGCPSRPELTGGLPCGTSRRPGSSSLH